MRYAQYYVMGNIISEKPPYNKIGEQVVERLGSDGVFPLDARFNLFNSIDQARDRAKMLNKNLNTGIVGFTIRKGDSERPFSRYTTVSNFIKVQ